MKTEFPLGIFTCDFDKSHWRGRNNLNCVEYCKITFESLCSRLIFGFIVTELTYYKMLTSISKLLFETC